jgi:hypothetical protein
MKASELKKLIEESVRKVIQEELKEILIEAVKSPKQVIRESYTPSPTTPPPSFTQPTMDVRQKYKDILGETAMSFTSNDISMPFTPSSVDPVNGSLGHGELGLDQIMGLINNR